jgi:hypothetical protein
MAVTDNFLLIRLPLGPEPHRRGSLFSYLACFRYITFSSLSHAGITIIVCYATKYTWAGAPGKIQHFHGQYNFI